MTKVIYYGKQQCAVSAIGIPETELLSNAVKILCGSYCGRDALMYLTREHKKSNIVSKLMAHRQVQQLFVKVD